MPIDFGPDFEREALEAFTYWKAIQLTIVTDPNIIAAITAMTFEDWLKRIMRAPVYENLSRKRANIDDAGTFFGPIPGSIDGK